MTADAALTGLARLRAPFPPGQVGLLPKVTCRECSNPKVQCQNHNRRKCDTCGAYVSVAHIHLDYVGHGAVTDRLLEVDPEWNWKPLATDQAGLPTFVFDKAGNPTELWIELTVCGVTRLGVGTCPSGQFDAAMVLIGDALRNAAMRFGVALDLWVKGHGDDDERTSATEERSAPERAKAETDPAAIAQAEKLRADVLAAVEPLDAGQYELFVDWATKQNLPPAERLSVAQAEASLSFIATLAPAEETGDGSGVPAPTATGEGVGPPPSGPAPDPDPEDAPGAATLLRQQAEDYAAKAAAQTKGKAK